MALGTPKSPLIACKGSMKNSAGLFPAVQDGRVKNNRCKFKEERRNFSP